MLPGKLVICYMVVLYLQQLNWRSMASILTNHGAHNLRGYWSVNVNANGAPIIDDGTGKPKRTPDGRLALGDGERLLTAKTGHPARVAQSIKLVDADAGPANSPTVLRLMAALVEKIEVWEGAADSCDLRPDGGMLIRDFYHSVFLPYIKNHKAPSTYDSHRGYWDAYLRDHFNHTKTLKGYEPYMGTNFLEQLAKTLSANTVKNVRAVGSAIFAYATGKGYISANPWSDVLQRIQCQEVDETVTYTVRDIESRMAALEHPSPREAYSARMAQIVMATCFYAGLRPSEAAALRWENVSFDESSILVCEAFVSGQHKTTTKTKKDRTVPMLASLRNQLRIWHAERSHPNGGLVFPNQSGTKPININDLSSRIIGPMLKKHGLDWAGLYACRRGFGQLAVDADMTLEEASVCMGNSPDVMWRHYYKTRSSKLAVGGMAKLEHALKGDAAKARILTAGSAR